MPPIAEHLLDSTVGTPSRSNDEPWSYCSTPGAPNTKNRHLRQNERVALPPVADWGEGEARVWLTAGSNHAGRWGMGCRFISPDDQGSECLRRC
jgi:hypothetical protein